MGIGKVVYGMLVSIFFGLIAYFHERKKIKQIIDIKPSRNDIYIEARVVGHISSIISSDIRPVLIYSNGGRKKYVFFSLKRRREYPIGKICQLKLSQKSGYAYDLKDILKGLVYSFFIMGWWIMGLVFSLVYVVKHFI